MDFWQMTNGDKSLVLTCYITNVNNTITSNSPGGDACFSH